MYKLEIQTTDKIIELENPLEARILTKSYFCILELKFCDGNWIEVYNFFSVYEKSAQSKINMDAVNCINSAIKNKNNYVFVNI